MRYDVCIEEIDPNNFEHEGGHDIPVDAADPEAAARKAMDMVKNGYELDLRSGKLVEEKLPPGIRLMIYAIDDSIDPEEMKLEDNDLYKVFKVHGAHEMGVLCRGFNTARKPSNSEAAHKINMELGWTIEEIMEHGADY
jgi:hypothetical protein